MSGRPRAVAAIVATGVLVLALGAAGDEAAERPLHTRIDLPSVAACGGCHVQVYREWARSLHAGAWTNANARRATRDFARVECRPCHSPRPVLATGLDRPPVHRAYNQEDGVHCLSCHGRADGVAARRSLPDAPCKPVEDARLTGAALCYPCHEPTHGAFEEYHRSEAYAEGKACADCHMPARADGQGRSHGPHGGFDPAFVRKGLSWRAAVRDGELLVRLRNRTGHRFPGEIPSRSLLVIVERAGQADEVVELRKPRKGELRDENRLEPDEVRTLRFPLGPDVNEVRVRILFRPLPLLELARAFELGAWSWSPSRGG